MDVRLSFDLPMIVAIVLGELISNLWYSNLNPFDRLLEHRYFVTALICDVALVLVIKNILTRAWGVRKWQDAAELAVWMTLLVAALEAPHFVYGIGTLSHFAFHVLHKFTLIFVMICVIELFKRK